MAKNQNIDVLVVDESIVHAWTRDGMTFGIITAVLMLNHFVFQSTPFEWILAFCWIVWVLCMSTNLAKRQSRTPEEAADYLWRKYGVSAHGDNT